MQPEQPLDQGQVDDWSPSVRVGSGVTLAGYVNQIRERRYRALKLTPDIRELAQNVAGNPDAAPESPQSQIRRVRALDEWVRKNINAGGSFDEPASSILARREGRRDVLLLALLKAAGIAAETWLARPENNPKLEGPLPDALAYSEMLLAVAKDEKGTPLLWLDPLYRHTPTGQVRPLLRGAQAIRLPDSLSEPKNQTVDLVRVDVPHAGGIPARLAQAQPDAKWPTLTDTRKVELVAELEPSGSAKVVVTETLTGIQSSEWRDQVEHMAEDRLRQLLEQRALGYYFPGASLQALKYGPMDDDDAPLTLSYTFTAPHLARQRLGKDGKRMLVLPVPYPLLLSRRYVTTPQRKLPLLVGYVTPGTLTATTGGGVTVTGSATSRVLTGTLASINSFVGGNNVRFTTAANATANVTLSLTINDNGNTGAGGARTATASTTLQPTATNDAPVLVAPATIETSIVAPAPLTGITASDVDAASGNVSLQFIVTAGTLTATSGGGVAVAGSGTGTVALTGTISAIAAYLAATPPSYDGPAATLSLTLNDGGNTGSGGAGVASASVQLVPSFLLRDGFEGG